MEQILLTGFVRFLLTSVIVSSSWPVDGAVVAGAFAPHTGTTSSITARHNITTIDLFVFISFLHSSVICNQSAIKQLS